MPRLARKCPPGLPVHVIQRGNNRQLCLASDSDLKAYANELLEASVRFSVSIHAWVFMTKHVHLLMTPSCWSGISRVMQFLGRFYVRYFNSTYGRTGTLYEGRFESSIVQDQHYLLACQCYMEMNPVRAGLVEDPADYLWSGYRAHAFGINVRMWTPHPEYRALGTTQASRLVAYRNLFNCELDGAASNEIRNAANTGPVLGNDRFRTEVERLTGQRQLHLKRGPKRKSKPNEEFLL